MHNMVLQSKNERDIKASEKEREKERERESGLFLANVTLWIHNVAQQCLHCC